MAHKNKTPALAGDRGLESCRTSNSDSSKSNRAALRPQHQSLHRILDRRSLPTPTQYLARAGLRLGKRRGLWISVCCPAHKGGAEANPSMSVHLDDGHFRCFACGVKGGDILALHRLMNPSLGFLDAVADLGGRFHD